MYGINNYELFIFTGILLNLTPGTDTLYIISRSISQGRKAGVFSALGIATGAVIHTFLTAFGLSIILMKSLIIFNIIKYIGVISLVYLGVRMLFAKKTSNPKLIISNEIKLTRIYIQGILTNVFNPKVALFYIAFLPQFVSTNHYGAVPFIILGFTFILTGTIWCLIIALFASYATKRLRGNSKIALMLNKITGIVFVGMGLLLINAKAKQ
jgi:threonine/homoserine/homoserine lactone efflux protein